MVEFWGKRQVNILVSIMCFIMVFNVNYHHLNEDVSAVLCVYIYDLPNLSKLRDFIYIYIYILLSWHILDDIPGLYNKPGWFTSLNMIHAYTIKLNTYVVQLVWTIFNSYTHTCSLQF